MNSLKLELLSMEPSLELVPPLNYDALCLCLDPAHDHGPLWRKEVDQMTQHQSLCHAATQVVYPLLNNGQQSTIMKKH